MKRITEYRDGQPGPTPEVEPTALGICGIGAVFGAGHLAAKFINFYALEGLIECVIDDHENKREMLMPGSRLPIRGAAALKDIDICLLSLNPESERKVVAKHHDFRDSGGQFMSIFALNPNSVYRDSVK